MPSRRTFLTTGGAAAMIGGLGLTACVHGPGLAQARAPWSQAGDSFGDPRLDALAYAILAPNPHNRQPWQFELVGDNQIDIYCDLDRRLPHTDPFDRQITIGFGCMTELLRQAAAERGYSANIVPFPDGAPQPRLDGRRIAAVTLSPEANQAKDPLFTAVLERRSTKEPFDTERPVSADTLARLIAAAPPGSTVDGTIDTALRQKLIDLAWQGFLIEMETDHTRKESIDLMRIGNRAVNRNPDGIDMGGMSMGLLKLLGFVSHESLDREGSRAYQTGIDMYRDIVQSAMGFVWVVTDKTRESQLKAGATWVRLNLAAQQMGLAVHPLSQVLQEYPEMAGPYQAARDALKVTEDHTLQMLGRIGYTKFPAAAPRWPLESKLISRAA